MQKKFDKPLTAAFLIREYIEKNKSAKTIMDEFGFSASKVIKRLKKLGIKKSPELKFKNGNAELKTKEALEKMYLVDGLSITQISEKFGCTPGAVTKLFNSRNIRILKKFRYRRVRKNWKKRSENLRDKQKMRTFEKEAKRQKFRKLGVACSEEKRLKLSEKAIDRLVQLERRTSSEIKTTQILKSLKDLAVYEQVGVKIYKDNHYIKGYITDYLLNIVGAKHHIILEVDSEYHHNKIPEIVTKDSLENNFLCNFNFIVIRIDSESISEENIVACINEAKNAYRPIIIKFNKILTKEVPKKIEEANYKHKLTTFNHTTKQVISM